MKIAVLGATGQTGSKLIALALEQKHHVLALVRSPDKVKIKHDNLRVETCNVFSLYDLQSKMADVEVVISCLGFFRSPRAEVDGYSRSIELISDACRQNQVKQLIVMGSWYNEDCGRDAGQGLSGFIMRFFLRHIIGKTLQDMKRMHQYLREHCTDLNWSIVNPPGLTNGALTTNGFVYEEGDRIKERCNQVQRISRADVACFMLEMVALGIYNQSDQNQKQIAVNMQI